MFEAKGICSHASQNVFKCGQLSPWFQTVMNGSAAAVSDQNLNVSDQNLTPKSKQTEGTWATRMIHRRPPSIVWEGVAVGSGGGSSSEMTPCGHAPSTSGPDLSASF